MPQNGIIFGALVIGFVFYVTIKGRLAQYISLFWTEGQSRGGGGNPLNSVLPANSPSTAGNTLPAMPSLSSYSNSLPGSDTSFWGVTQGLLTGYGPSGLPTYPTLYKQTQQAASYVLGGAAGL